MKFGKFNFDTLNNINLRENLINRKKQFLTNINTYNIDTQFKFNNTYKKNHLIDKLSKKKRIIDEEKRKHLLDDIEKKRLLNGLEKNNFNINKITHNNAYLKSCITDFYHLDDKYIYQKENIYIPNSVLNKFCINFIGNKIRNINLPYFSKHSYITLIVNIKSTNNFIKIGDENGKINYETAFNEEGIEDLNKNIVILNNGKKHQPIKKVKWKSISL